MLRIFQADERSLIGCFAGMGHPGLMFLARRRVIATAALAAQSS
jgi:hypothetical protein